MPASRRPSRQRASGNPTPTTVQWQVSTDGGNTFNPIAGATSTTLSITNATAAQNGTEYEAIFSNSVGSVTTSAATLTVDYAPTVTSNPTNMTVNAGQTATFTASASDGNPTPTTVQWQVSTNGGQTLQQHSGATSTTLTLTTRLPPRMAISTRRSSATPPASVPPPPPPR